LLSMQKWYLVAVSLVTVLQIYIIIESTSNAAMIFVAADKLMAWHEVFCDRD